MKYLKSSLTFLLLTVFMFTSCNKDDETQIQQQNPVEIQKSQGLRTFLNVIKNLKVQTNATARTTNDEVLCFDFVYPITLGYNNGTTVEVGNLDALIEVLISENEELYIEGIVFPFDIVFSADQNVMTIENEEDILTALDTCEYNEGDDQYGFCDYIVQFPVEIIVDGETIEINSMDEFNQEIEFEIVFPITLIDANTQEEIVVESEDMLEELMYDCEGDDIDDEILDLFDFDTVNECFTMNYPLSMTFGNEVVTFNSYEEISTHFENLTEEYVEEIDGMIDFVFPFSVTLLDDEQTQVTINNHGDFSDLLNLCFGDTIEEGDDDVWTDEEENEEENEEESNDDEQNEEESNDDEQNEEESNDDEQNEEESNDDEQNEEESNDDEQNEEESNDDEQNEEESNDDEQNEEESNDDEQNDESDDNNQSDEQQ
ncbi:hypothetical protein [Aureivirga marina]|uniref:hypothetical protein n=1 Tax=Aureivirga marina TaxID=1182451 RepID=UPI0018CAAA1F|nr:hypothetical protein [Aureivirga marina]